MLLILQHSWKESRLGDFRGLECKRKRSEKMFECVCRLLTMTADPAARLLLGQGGEIGMQEETRGEVCQNTNWSLAVAADPTALLKGMQPATGWPQGAGMVQGVASVPRRFHERVQPSLWLRTQ